MIRFDGELAESYEINCAENYEKVSAKFSLIECERKIFPDFPPLASIHVIILTSALGSILLSKHLTFCHPRLILSLGFIHISLFYCDPIYRKEEKKNAIERKKKFVQKIYE